MSRLIRFGVVSFDQDSRVLRKNGDPPVKLEPLHASLLDLFLASGGELVSHQRIQDHLWPDTFGKGRGDVRRVVSELRTKLKDNGHDYITSDWGKGYLFVAPIFPLPPTLDSDPVENEGEAPFSPGPIPEPIAAEPPTPNHVAAAADAQHSPAPVPLPTPAKAPERLAWAKSAGLSAMRYIGIGTIMIFLVRAFWQALDQSAYGLAIAVLPIFLLVILTAGHVCTTMRAGLALLSVFMMSYIASASTLPYVVSTVINANTLPPSPIYPAITGLKFIPVCVLVLGFWVLLGAFDDEGFQRHPLMRAVYLVLIPAFLVATGFSLVQASADYQIWQAQIPGAKTLINGYLWIIGLNLAIGGAGFYYFNQKKVSYGPLMGLVTVGYFFIAVSAFFVDREYNVINQYHLDQRRPIAYRVEHPDAVKRFRQTVPPELQQAIGRDLLSLLRDPQFERVLREDVFYKQNFDEAFQLSQQAVMYGHRKRAVNGPGAFEIIRFPRAVADELGFSPLL